MRSAIKVTLCLAVTTIVALACGRSGLTIIPMPTITATSALSATDMVTETAETATPPPIQPEDFMPPDRVTEVGGVLEARVQESIFQLEVASTSSERASGLMGRVSLPEDAAMLFVYEGEEHLNFWMKNTLIPLDILFLNTQGVVVDVQTMQTQIEVTDGDLKLYRSASPARFALEMNAGLAEILGVVPGSQVLFR
jgi:uncharacterized membrane protein (UPF0127 family)